MNKEITVQEALRLIDDKYDNFKKFIEYKKPIYCEIKEDSNEIIFDEVDYFGRQYMIIVPLKVTNKNPQIIFRDDLTDIDRLWELYSIDTDITKPTYNKLQLDISNLGCKLYDSGCGSNDDYTWFDLSINMKDFSEELLQKCTKLWTDYNRKLNTYIKSIK